MCFKGKLFSCLSVETACLTMAIINVIVNLLNLVWYTWLWGVAIMTYLSRDRFYEMESSDQYYTIDGLDDLNMNMDIRTWHWSKGHVAFYFFMIPLTSLLTLLFSFLLCFGIRNRRLGLVTAYLVYGSVITVLASLVSIVLLNVDSQPDAGLWVLFVCAMHSLFLLLVLLTHKKLADKQHILCKIKNFQHLNFEVVEVGSSNFAENIRLVVEDNRHFKSVQNEYILT